MVVIEEIKGANATNSINNEKSEDKNVKDNITKNDDKIKKEENVKKKKKKKATKEAKIVNEEVNKIEEKNKENVKEDDNEEEKGNGVDTEGEAGGGSSTKQTKSEKRARSALTKLGLKPVPGVLRVRLRKDKNISFIIKNPEVFKCANSDTYVIFGDVKPEDVNAQTRAQMAEKFTQNLNASAGSVIEEEKGKVNVGVEKAEKEVYVEEKDAENMEGLEEKDVALVMVQASCSRAKAINALRKHNNDIVEAIMYLS